jgi:hypothetical protein
MEVPMKGESEKNKRKLTLAVDPEVVRRAKAAGINISALTETLLRAITFEPAGNTDEDLRKAYQSLFKIMAYLLMKYQASLTVGEFKNKANKILSQIVLDWDYESADFALYTNDSTSFQPVDLGICIISDALYDPQRILENLIMTLIEKAEANKEKIDQLKFALRFLKALSEEVDNKR